MRVLHVCSSIDPRAGGPAVAVVGLARAQKRCGIDVGVVATHIQTESIDAVESLKQEAIDAHPIGPAALPLRTHPQIDPTLEALIRTADVVHIHALWEQIQHRAARIAHQLGKAYIFRPCGMLDPWSLAQSRLRKRIYMALRLRKDLNRAAAIHYTAETERNLASPLNLKPPAIVEPNGLDLGEFADLPDSQAFRTRFPQIAGRRIVLFLSRIHHKKGLDLLIPAFARAKLDNCALVIAGPDDDGYGQTVRRMIEENHVGDHVVFTGLLKGRDRVAAYAAAELFVLPSYQENFGIVVVEALAARCPVVISDQVNIHNEISTAQVGAVIPTRVDALADALKTWLSDESLRSGAARRAQGFARDHYDWNAIARRWQAHYHRVAS